MDKSILDVEVSCFDNIKATLPKPVNLLEWISTPKHLKEMEVIRNTTDEDVIRNIKSSLPAITPSGVFEFRNEQGLLRHTGFIQADIDFKDNMHLLNFGGIKSELAKLENVAYCGLSVSGKGYWVILPICYPGRHRQHFDFIEKVFKQFEINIDISGKDITRLRIYSHDPDAYYNHAAIPLLAYEKEDNINVKDEFVNDVNKDHAVVQAYVQMILKHEIDITVGYTKWFHIGCALSKTFQENGRMYFHHVSQFNEKYNKKRADLQYTKCLGMNGKISLGTFIHHCKEAGITRDFDIVSYNDDEIEIEFTT